MASQSQAGTAAIERIEKTEGGPTRVLLSVTPRPAWVEVSKWSDFIAGDVVYWERTEAGQPAIVGRLNTLSANALLAVVAESAAVSKSDLKKQLGFARGEQVADPRTVLERLGGLLDRSELSRLHTMMRDEVAFRIVVAAWARDGIEASHCRRLHAAIGEGVMPLIAASSLSAAKSGQFTFADAAEVARRRGEASDPQLIRAAIEKTLAENELNGSIFMGCQALINEVGKKLQSVGAALASPGLHLGVMSAESRISIARIKGVLCVALRGTAVLEKKVAGHIARLSASAPADALPGALRSLSIELSDPFQRAAVAGAHAGVTVITGGPGTGKTTISSLIARAADRVGLKTIYLAPTGAAAERSGHSTGRGSCTVHAAIYTKESERLDEADIVIVDEPSMLDIRTASLLLARIKSGCRLILIGDPEQLESVDAGNFLADLIDSKTVSVFSLQNIYRTDEGSLICVNSKHFLNGRPGDVRFGENFSIFETKDDEEIANGILSKYMARLQRSPSATIQVLSPVNKGACGVWELNKRIKAFVNPGDGKEPIKGGFGNIFHAGDRVVRTKNARRLGLANGTVGVLGVHGSELFLDTGSKKIRLTKKMLGDFSLAYAQTIHKAQGSEYDAVVMAVPGGAAKMLNRKLSRTAMTRAKHSVDFVGSKEVLLASALKPGANRITSLVQALVEAQPKAPKKLDVRVRAI